MDAGLEGIFANLSDDEISKVAASVLGVTDASAGPIELAEITTPHADARTIGIVRVSGTAEGNDGPRRAWSSVTKLIDMTMQPFWKEGVVNPLNEVRVYEEGHFADAGTRLRPARCYHISRPRDGLTILWLEDLTDALGTPFGVDVLGQMVRHLGEWNGRMIAAPPRLGFPVGTDFQVRSWEGWGYPDRAADLRTMSDEAMTCAMYARQPIDVTVELVALFGELVERSKSLPHGLGLADCPVSNFFYRPDETIAIDWAGLGNEPIGGDGGRFIGSALTWGRRFADVAEKERDLFDAYATGLLEGGYQGNRDTVRMGYLSELGFYVCNLATLPTALFGPRVTALPHDFFERRFGYPLADIGGVASRVIDLLPSYVAELRDLLATSR